MILVFVLLISALPPYHFPRLDRHSLKSLNKNFHSATAGRCKVSTIINLFFYASDLNYLFLYLTNEKKINNLFFSVSKQKIKQYPKQTFTSLILSFFTKSKSFNRVSLKFSKNSAKNRTIFGRK